MTLSPANAAPTDAESPAHDSARPLSVLFLGTSLTLRGGWTEPVEAALARCLNRPVVTRTIALSGANSDWGIEQLPLVLDFHPDLVTIEFSMNDAALQRGMSLTRSLDNVETMIQRIRGEGGDRRIILMAMNPVAGLRGWARPRLDSYYDAYGALSASKSVEFVDFRPDWLALADARDAAIPDGVHPTTEAGARIVAPKLVRAIAGRDCQ
ncbi:GDSL-type esterase/lipase family protein [Kaistia dalseonensis]|uniref:Lysophospholipase L1-like esterase n=1 Tax=Kaistia dalseonensis TaxID=410840 RepID=A0ABU0H213_9HYPH|nr:GDSL-type esterase/lipase family protein [Kaistia dalseonensis]MCX5493772.1 GDSL-type esterase/lipase family protein [Kaistia dalseonensis]MDQ0436336.1 lysophospholipase L1-like esterase [Kaistia dalseonensis]